MKTETNVRIRVTKERAALIGKINKLERFLETLQDFATGETPQLLLLKQQLVVMEQYAALLTQRLDLLPAE
ncbi:hypothetical protein HUU62_08690 [Rhodoferax sp. 4810]|uniref:Uncharacterized protein n=1 Tax=Thiospirillum jenense TaxID=1653858 RepID=A0A839H8X7_9GAMM|nr:hypothetical protein [Thiospirillum jenense]MBB1074486.1 hypothetical protein [Rhodoferax jenense]MBB1125531.1 hypothetical protein [Thiospirillum jenense]